MDNEQPEKPDMKHKLLDKYLFSNTGEQWEEHTLTRVDKHIYPFCADYRRFKYIKELN